jgi:hypothetical protein
MLPGNTPALFKSGAGNSGPLPIMVNVGNDSFTKLLLHCEGAHTSTVFNDSSPAAHGNASPSGTIYVSTVGSKFGTGSMWQSGNGYVAYANHADWEFGAGNFTVDWWEYRAAAGGCAIARDLPTTYAPFLLGYDLSGALHVYATSNGSSWDLANGAGGHTLGPTTYNAWTHLAVSRSNGVFYAFKNGLLQNTWSTGVGALVGNGNPLCIGAAQNAANINGFTDEIRITKGHARYVAAFFPRSAAYPVSISSLRVLHNFDGSEGGLTMTDDAGGRGGVAAHSWNAIGTAKKTTSGPKFGTACLTLDGSGYVEAGAYEDFNLGNDDFTIDFWFNTMGLGNGTTRRHAGQAPSDANGIFTSFGTAILTTNFIYGNVFSGSTNYQIIGTTAITAAGWHHYAFVRTANTLKLFLDGVQENGNVTITTPVNPSPNKIAIGRLGEFPTNPWLGKIDAFRMSVGQALWTTNFIPPTAPAA